MIPSLAVVRVGGRRGAVRLWLPLFLLWPLLLPLAVAGLFVARVYGVATAGALRAAWRSASGLRGLHVEVDGPGAAFLVRFI
ncbi:hypothetical protein [Actinoplanes sp. NPDC049118]|uniref:hypothetical protein n=1 Tax=Actinoplanes sp. NPDC049118 TaxID=3155769 RepID=UPI0034003993